MNFDLTEGQRVMVQIVKDFATKEIAPNLRREEFDRELVRKMGSLSVKYARERVQFGRPIRDYQMVKQIVADMVTYTEAARLLVRWAAWLNDQGRPFTREVAIAKYFAGEAAVRAAGWAMEIHGGMGYSTDIPVEKYYRDSKMYQVGEGTANIMRLIIADDAMGVKKARPLNDLIKEGLI